MTLNYTYPEIMTTINTKLIKILIINLLKRIDF